LVAEGEVLQHEVTTGLKRCGQASPDRENE
jgi:hypothetical protein